MAAREAAEQLADTVRQSLVHGFGRVGQFAQRQRLTRKCVHQLAVRRGRTVKGRYALFRKNAQEGRGIELASKNACRCAECHRYDDAPAEAAQIARRVTGHVPVFRLQILH